MQSGAYSGFHSSSWDDVLIVRAAPGAAPLSAHLVNAVYEKLKSVGVETTLLQG